MADNENNRAGLLTALKGGGKPDSGEAGPRLITSNDVELEDEDDSPGDQTDSDDDDAAGPSDDEGEPTDDDTGDDADQDEDDQPQDDDQPEDDDEPTDEGEPEVDEDEDDQELDDGKPRKGRGDDGRLAALQGQIQALQQLVIQQRQPQLPVPQGPVETSLVPQDIPDNLLQAALYGADAKVWETVPEQTRNRAFQWAQEHAAREVKFLRNPGARYAADFEARVQQHVARLVGPLMADYHDRQAQDLKASVFDKLDPKVATRAKAIFEESGVFATADWKVIRNTAKAAATQAQLESLQRAERKMKDQKNLNKVQKKANGGGKLKAGNRTNTSGGSNGKFPVMGEHEGPEAYAARVSRFIKNNPGA